MRKILLLLGIAVFYGMLALVPKRSDPRKVPVPSPEASTVNAETGGSSDRPEDAPQFLTAEAGYLQSLPGNGEKDDDLNGNEDADRVPPSLRLKDEPGAPGTMFPVR